MPKRETMSDTELKRMQELNAKFQRVKRHDNTFFKEVDERREEVLDHLGVSNDKAIENQDIVNELKIMMRDKGFSDLDKFMEFIDGVEPIEKHMNK